MVMVSTNALLQGFFAELSAASWLVKDLLPPLLAGVVAGRITSGARDVATASAAAAAAAVAAAHIGAGERRQPALLSCRLRVRVQRCRQPCQPAAAQQRRAARCQRAAAAPRAATLSAAAALRTAA